MAVTAWEWQWLVGRNSISVAVSLLGFAVGFSTAARDVVIYLGPVTVIIEYWPPGDAQ